MSRALLGAAVGLSGFVLCALTEIIFRGLAVGAVVGFDGRVSRLTGGWFVWVAGAVIALVAAGVVLLARQAGRAAWAGAAVALGVLLLLGSITAATRGLDVDQAPVHPALLWLMAGASSAATWILAGLASALALTRRTTVTVS